MNVEKLYYIANRLIEDRTKLDLLNNFNAFRTSFSKVVNPSQNQNLRQNPAQNQKAFKEIKDSFFALLEESDFNNFSFSDLQIVKEIGGYELLGNNLKKTLQSILEGSGILPIPAFEEITKIYSKVSAFYKNLEETIKICGAFNIESNQYLEEGQSAITITFPTEVIRGDFGNFQEDIEFFRWLLDRISLIINKDQKYRIDKIYSGSFVFVFVTGMTFVSFLIKNIINPTLDAIKKIEEIKRIRLESENLKLKNEILIGLKEEEDEKVSNYTEEIVKNISESPMVSEEFLKGKTQKNENENHFRKLIKIFMAKLDNGYQISISETKREQDDETETENIDYKNYIEEIKKLNNNMSEFSKAIAEQGSILKLPPYSENKEDKKSDK